MKHKLKKTTYSEALRLAEFQHGKGEKANNVVQAQIEAGYVGDPNKRKTCNWKFKGTDMTINKSTGPNPKKSIKRGAKNKVTHDLIISSKLLKKAYNEIYETVKGLQEEGEFSKIDEAVFIDNYKNRIVNPVKRSIFDFLKENGVK